MKYKLVQDAYGKNAINLSKVTRHEAYHEFRQISVNVSLQGDFETVYTQGNNRKILPTDTQKNTVYALAKDHFVSSIEDFAIHLANHFFSNNPQVSQTTIEITEHLYSRMSFDGSEHPHTYQSKGNEKHVTTVVQDAHKTSVTSGIKGLLILKTTNSAFTDYIKDRYTTLKETTDRIFATECEATWVYNSYKLNFAELFEKVRNACLRTFAFHNSLSVQQTLYAMGEAVLEENPEIKEISLIMPNKHHIPFNLQQFGMENDNEIFIATDEPFGYITGTITREEEN
ncbi:factor-independent urate hydroxylase [Segetibacter aerophilus]|uniref:Uricase n=1 Tax=Segetibacter aerophilus TaxID=670293 RepID=A0A512B7P7_9BACT|nr:urate oxidase [Segetibacter aerophilus]GEO07981.1 uricase [Segetibacter aerophilus]